MQARLFSDASAKIAVKCRCEISFNETVGLLNFLGLSFIMIAKI